MVNVKAILASADERPWLKVDGPWIMNQAWHQLLFAHWPLDPAQLRPLIPRALPLDTYEGEAWVGVVPFRMSQVFPRGTFSVPWLSQFHELNVRTYVTVKDKPGVYFFCLDASNPIAVALARSLFHLPYFNAIMSSEIIDDVIHYKSHRTHRGAAKADYDVLYRPTGPVFQSVPGTLEHWFTERYCLYTTVREQVSRCDILHKPWPLQPAELEIRHDTMARAHGIALPDTPPLLHYADFIEMLAWPPKSL